MNIIRLVCSLCLFFHSVQIFAQNQIWKIEGANVALHYNNELNAYTSIECPSSGCYWDKIKKEKMLRKIEIKETTGGKNPGSVVCQSIIGAKVVMGTMSNMQTQSFCLFSDKTMISTQAVYSEWILQHK